MIAVEFAPRFKKDLKQARRHFEYNREDPQQLIEDLSARNPLPTHYNEHSLEKRGVNWAGFRECHLGGDLVVIFVRLKSLVRLHRIGGHEAMFRK